jgi:hypothetical protein
VHIVRGIVRLRIKKLLLVVMALSALMTGTGPAIMLGACAVVSVISR